MMMIVMKIIIIIIIIIIIKIIILIIIILKTVARSDIDIGRNKEELCFNKNVQFFVGVFH